MTGARRRLLARQLKPNFHDEQTYVAGLQRVMQRVHDSAMSVLRPALQELTGKQDGNTWVSSAFDVATGKAISEVSDLVGGMFDAHARAVLSDNAKKLSILGIPASNLRLGPELSKRRNENIRLVEKAGREYAAQVREIFEAPDVNGMRVEDLAAKLEERGNVSKNRATLIARDQTLKLNSAITKTRQENAGISRYTWSTSLDERVREEHRALEGQVFDWNAPPPVGHPGEDFQCRCIAVPILDELNELGPANAPEEESAPDVAPEVEAAQPVAPEPRGIEAGTHVRTIDSSLSAADTKEILSSLADDETRALLAQPGSAVDTIFMRESGINIGGQRVDGSYNYLTRRLEIATTRPAAEINHPWVPGRTFKVSAAASSVRDAAKIDLRHELGHHIHGGIGRFSRGPAPVLDEVSEAYRRARAAGVFITQYAGTNDEEYFAESYAAYFHRKEDLRRHDPNGFAMVEKVLQLRGAQK